MHGDAKHSSWRSPCAAETEGRMAQHPPVGTFFGAGFAQLGIVGVFFGGFCVFMICLLFLECI